MLLNVTLAGKAVNGLAAHSVAVVQPAPGTPGFVEATFSEIADFGRERRPAIPARCAPRSARPTQICDFGRFGRGAQKNTSSAWQQPFSGHTCGSRPLEVCRPSAVPTDVQCR